MEWLAGLIAEVARKMGSGEGFWITLGLYLAMVMTERVAYLFEDRGRPWDEREALANVRNSTFTALVEPFLGGAVFIAIYLFLYEHARLFDIPFLWWGWVAAFLFNDLAYYLDHRMAHRTGLFWAIHVPHHSSREMNLLVANRGTIVGFGIGTPVYFALPILGLHPAMFLAVKFFGNLWGIFNHTRLVQRMGVLDNWLCTPANHRVHHGTQPKYLDRNYGQTLLIWDRMFGSWQREEEEPVYGLVTQMDSRRVWDIQTWGLRWLIGQMRSATRWPDRLRYLYKPPGWRHDGCHQTTEAILKGMPAFWQNEAERLASPDRYCDVMTSTSRLALASLAALLLAGGAAAQEEKDSRLKETGRKAGEIATQPARDVGVAKTKIPPVLATAAADPYSLKGLKTCRQLSAAVTELNGVLGTDFQTGQEKKENRAGKIAEAGGKTIVNSIIPFRGLVREITGAAPAQRRLNAAIDAGYARRGFLRGVHATRKCRTKF